ncbi:MAG: hypothetical protein KDI56_06835 [Xanthomonadales bacterium]|nr:hypothetical protein [Xanthomonadales bacterium]
MSMALRWPTALLLLGLSGIATAEIRGIYHPYVNQGERELEYQLLWRGDGETPSNLQQISFGYGWTDRFATEIYLLTESVHRQNRRSRGFELEALWQLTEQGEYWADWGLLLEAEADRAGTEREVAVSLLLEKELAQRWVGTVNAQLEYEFGDDIDNEIETALRAQLRYLHSPALEPALDLYLDDQDYAIGPTLLGAHRLAPGRQLRWELGLPIGLNDRTPDVGVRLSLELEF